MLVLTRRIGEKIVLPDCGVTIMVVSVTGTRVRLGVSAPAAMPIHRSEVWQHIAAGKGTRRVACPIGDRMGSTSATRNSGHAGPRRPKQKKSQDIERELTDAIAERTEGRLRSLAVRLLGDRIAIHGHASSYYAVQLAHAGLIEAIHRMDLDLPDKIELNVEIVPTPEATGHRG